MKLFLRYQISGSVFIGWFLLFHYSVHSADFADMATKIMDISSLASLIIAMPIGAIIHQFSVTIKNQIFGLCEDSYLSDSPLKKPTKTMLVFYQKKIKNDDTTKEISLEYFTYIKDKITNLNSFYYMRFDCGFLAPLLAIVLFCFIDNQYLTWFVAFIPICLVILLGMSLLYFVCKKHGFCKIKSFIALLLMLCVSSVIVKCCSTTTENKSNIELTTELIKIESNTRYVVTKDYSFESTDSMEPVYTKYIESNLILNRNSALKENYLIESKLQKTSILESANINNKQTISCTAKCAKCSQELNCTISNTPENKEESQLHISKAEITKISTELLNKILIACLIISFLLLSYIPRIIQELKEYTNELLQDKKINIHLIPKLKRARYDNVSESDK